MQRPAYPVVALRRVRVRLFAQVLACGPMAVPAILAGWAATHCGLAVMVPWFTADLVAACLLAGVLGTTGSRPEVVRA